MSTGTTVGTTTQVYRVYIKTTPEAIWQAAIWWGKYYKAASKAAADGVVEPEGLVNIRQLAAAVHD